MICLTDLLATCAAILNAELPETAGEDSYNILPPLVGEKLERPIREVTVHHSGAGVFAVRQGRWKLIPGTKGGGADTGPEPDAPGQLYDLVEDPHEQHDLWDERQDIVAECRVLLNKYLEEGGSAPEMR